MKERPFTRYVGLIKQAYENVRLMELLTNAEPGKTVTRAQIKKAKADPKDFEVQDSRYMEQASGGFCLTPLGKNLFDTQLIADRKDKSQKNNNGSMAHHNNMYLGLNGDPLKSFGAIEQDELGS